MKSTLISFFVLLTLWSLSSCKSVKTTVSTTPESTFWYRPGTTLHTVSNSEGVAEYDCGHLAVYSENQEEIGMNQEWKLFCGDIDQGHLKAGFIYLIKAYHSLGVLEDGTDASKYRVIEVLKKEKDPYYRKKEYIFAWIGPEIVESSCRYLHAPPDCKEPYYQIQYGSTVDVQGDWELSMDIMVGSISDYAAGHVYQVQYTRVYRSEFDPVVSDGSTYEVKDFKVLNSEAIKE